MSNELRTVSVTEDLTKAVGSALDPASIRAAVIAEAEKQGIVAADAAATQAAAEKAAADKAAAETTADSVFSRTEIIGGREFTFDASSELELERMVNNAFKVAYAVQTSEAEPTPSVTVDPAAI